MEEPAYQVLGAPRHHCHGCGACCFGHDVPLIDDDEIARVARLGAELGVPDPVVDGHLRFERGRCVFHGADRLCELHRSFGMEAKPLRCQVWPLKLVRTEGELRLGIDPGCANTWRSWRTGEVQEPVGRVVVRPGRVSAQERQVEMAFLGLASRPDATIAGLLHALAGTPPTAALPDGMGRRLAVRARAIRLGQLLAKDEIGDGIRESLAHLVPVVDGLDPDAPPPFVLGAEEDRFAVEVVRRKLYLREAPVSPAVHGLMVLTLLGAVVSAWADPRPEVFGPALSAWTRLMRLEAFWLRVAPELAILEWICTGRYEGELGDPGIVVGRG